MEFTMCHTVFCSIWATVLCGTPVVKQQGFSLALIVIVSLDICGLGKNCNFLVESLEEYKEFEWLSNALLLWVHQLGIGENCSRWFWASLHRVFSDTDSSFPCSVLRLLVSRNCTNRCLDQMNHPDLARKTEHIGLLFLGKNKQTRYYTTIAVVDQMTRARK